jgi:hypothetical protein
MRHLHATRFRDVVIDKNIRNRLATGREQLNNSHIRLRRLWTWQLRPQWPRFPFNGSELYLHPRIQIVSYRTEQVNDIKVSCLAAPNRASIASYAARPPNNALVLTLPALGHGGAWEA